MAEAERMPIDLVLVSEQHFNECWERAWDVRGVLDIPGKQLNFIYILLSTWMRLPLTHPRSGHAGTAWLFGIRPRQPPLNLHLDASLQTWLSLNSQAQGGLYCLRTEIA